MSRRHFELIEHAKQATARAALVVACALGGFASPARSQEIPPPRLGGYFQARETWVEPTGLTATLNRARFSIDGTLPDRFSYRALVEMESGATARTAGIVSLRETIIRWSLAPWAIQVGQFKTPFSREYVIAVPALELADFSAVVDTLAPKYELGVMAEYAAPLVTLQIGAFNGEGQNAGLNRDSTVLWVGRASVRPIAQATLAGHLARANRDSVRYGADLSIEHAGLLVRGEFLGQWRRNRGAPGGAPGAAVSGSDDLGWYVLAGYRVLPWLQLLAKQEDFQRPALGVSRRISATIGGANLELPGGRTRFLANFVSRRTGFPRQKRNSVIGQVQVRF